MALLPGFEYDIFISYRHNDNRSGWVTEFVNALQEELASTIKEPITIYFDKNPHDGLLETHNVDKSLEGKLKCLIFIPIISQTYCDTKSFAWQYEFVAFNKMAIKGTPLSFGEGSGVRSFGRYIKLINGNVASRILPIKIHDLDAEDKTILENELGGVLRAVEFIFKSSGVNRPLLSHEDHPHDNLNKTFYRDQINKVANAVKEIVSSLKNPSSISIQTTGNQQPLTRSQPNFNRRSILITSLLIIIATAGFLFPKLFSTEEDKVIDKSIAVLPFTDISEAHDQAFFSDGMMVEILDHLFKIKDLRIIPRNSTLLYKDSTKPLKEIATELGVGHLIQGSVRRAGNKVKISVALVEGSTEKSLWQHTYEDDITEVSRIFAIQSDVASKIAIELKAQITPDVKKRIEAIPTQNQEAYDLFLKGRKESSEFWYDNNTTHVKAGIIYLNKAVALDSNFSDAFTALGVCYWWLAEYAPDFTPDYYRQSREYLNKAIALDPHSGWAYSQLAVNQYHNDWDKKAASQSLKKAMELNPSDITINNIMFWFCLHLQNCDSMQVTLDKLKELEPGDYHTYEVYVIMCRGQDRELQAVSPPENFLGGGDLRVELERLMILKKYEEVLAKMDLYKSFAPEVLFLELKGEVLGETGKKEEALEIIQKLEVLSKTQHIRPVRFAIIYMAIGDENKAYGYLEKSIEERGLWPHVLPYYAPFYRKRNDPRFQAFMKRTWVN